MVIDTSAVVAILQDEPERRAINEAIEAADSRKLSVASWVELSIVIESRLGAEGLRVLDRFVDRAGIELIPVGREHGEAARHAFCQFGKGKHAAGLNYGDCFSYALASVLNEPLLFKGEDFSRTDIAAVPYG